MLGKERTQRDQESRVLHSSRAPGARSEDFSRAGQTGLRRTIGNCLHPQKMVPSKGLEPPHRCRYMDLNHARLPIPPRWQVDLIRRGSHQAAGSGRPAFSILQRRSPVSNLGVEPGRRTWASNLGVEPGCRPQLRGAPDALVLGRALKAHDGNLRECGPIYASTRVALLRGADEASAPP
jgi:hypothetical protein